MAADPFAEKRESFFRVFFPAQVGQAGLSSAWSKRIILSNSRPQSGQTYSYNGIVPTSDVYTPGEYFDQSIPRHLITEQIIPEITS